MEKTYRNVGILFVFVFLLVIIGFYRTYFGLMPKFENVTSVVHFHAITLMIWSLLIIIQPLLIRYKKLLIHRQIGKFTYVLVPLIVYSTIALARSKFFERQGHIPESENLSGLFLPFSHMFLFSLFFILAIINKKRSFIHMRYIIVASFTVLAPAIVRINFSWTGLHFHPLMFSYAFTDLFIIGLIIFDWSNKKICKPYFVALALFMIVHFSTFLLTKTYFWQTISSKIVATIF